MSDAQRVTSLRMRMDGSGDASFGSGRPGALNGSGISDAEIAAATPLTFGQFTDLTRDPRYSDSMDPRAAEAFRRTAEAGLLRGEQIAAMGKALTTTTPADTAALIVNADSSVNPNIARLGVQHGPFISREERAGAYADPRYSTSQDFRDLVISRDAQTSF